MSIVCTHNHFTSDDIDSSTGVIIYYRHSQSLCVVSQASDAHYKTWTH